MPLDFKLKTSNNKEYKADNIKNSVVYTKKSIISQLSGLYYLILWKSYFE